MTTQAVRLFRRMDGLFSVYKPQGVHWKLVRDTIETNLLKGSVCVTCTVNSYSRRLYFLNVLVIHDYQCN